MNRSNQFTMQDPRSQYPIMNIPEQPQPEPGLDVDLQPQANHREDTYVGSGRLTGRRALVTGEVLGVMGCNHLP